MVIPLIPAVLVAATVGALGVIDVKPRLRRRYAGEIARLRREADVPEAPQAEGSIDFQRLIRDVVKALFSVDRQKLQGEMTPADLEAAEAAQRKSRRQMQISAGIMGLATTASFVPVLVPAAAAGVLYLMRDTFRLVWRDIKRGHYLSVYLIGAGMCLTMIATGHILLAAFASFMEGFFARIRRMSGWSRTGWRSRLPSATCSRAIWCAFMPARLCRPTGALSRAAGRWTSAS